MTNSSESPTVVRRWRGAIRTEDRDAYAVYLEDTGLREYRATEGNLGAWTLYRDLGDGRTEVVTVSHWVSREVIRGFAGDDIEMAVFYPEDDRYLVERDLFVAHYDLLPGG
ncbi:hypothetical protein ACFSBZ_00595 [Amnibacterium flavum]|uniref:ABM domain-containing protein n=1 Tax=Amnibacterium flavum TaxID=2173173 RepID=A0A2V1HLQ5_9MICO|nr:hypothetical protein [Amnibacterium flavum]PVZ93576.1 hypothetical protein DDQ50_14790 [Amnibacterium flavum]